MAETYRSREDFAVFVKGVPRIIHVGDVVSATDPLVAAKSPNRKAFQPMTEYIEQTTQAPGELRPVRMPSGVTADEATRARDVRNGPRRPKETDMPHALPPEHEDSPASPFAPGQPAAGVVADDVPPEQNPAGGPKTADAPTIEPTSPEPQTAQQAANADAQKDANAKSAKAKGK
jgi:hypothetical protein